MKAWLTLVGTTAAAGSFAVAPPQVRADDPKPNAVTLQVTATGFRNTKGQALFALYDSKESWLKPARARYFYKVPISDSEARITFSNLAPGVYAVSVIHDENTNNKLDMHWFPIPGPSEGAGVSNDATATFGPPSYADSRFQLGERGGVLTIKVRY